MKRNSTPQLIKQQLFDQSTQHDLSKIRQRIADGCIPLNITRKFNIGDKVSIGGLENTTVTDIYFSGLAYGVYYNYINETSREKHKEGVGIWAWMDVFPEVCGDTNFSTPFAPLIYMRQDISSLLHAMYYSGVNMNPEYQRELVWTLPQKIELIESLFNRIDIGKFTFILNDRLSNSKYYYEILDGKQRLSTICEFYEDRFKYRDKCFSELSKRDRSQFTTSAVNVAEITVKSEIEKYEHFIRLNTAGTPVDKSHLEKIKKLII